VAARAIPVTPQVVEWALNEDGRPLPELAQAIRVEVDTLDGWTSGDAKPTGTQFSRMVEVLKRPRALFFLPLAPAAASLPANFRHPPGEDRDVSADARRLIRQARRVQAAVSWARRDEPVLDLPRATVDSAPEATAETVRRWLAVSPSDRVAWRSPMDTYRGWRAALESRGVLVFELPIGSGDVRGFSAWDDRAPLIVANLTSVSPAARTFTLAHELGHLVTRQDSACLEPDGVNPFAGEIERWCEAFAGAFLMPRDEVRSLARERGIGDLAADLEDIQALMRRFGVSARASALRLIDLGYAPRTLYGIVLDVFRPAPRTNDPSRKISSPPRHEARIKQYGLGTVETVLSSLPQRDALSVLRLTVKDVRQMPEGVTGGQSF
jgi:Zn-dependent peptidase ImmA (M78 family)